MTKHQHFIRHCCLEALITDVLEDAEHHSEIGREKAEVVLEFLKIYLDDVWEPTQKE